MEALEWIFSPLKHLFFLTFSTQILNFPLKTAHAVNNNCQSCQYPTPTRDTNPKTPCQFGPLELPSNPPKEHATQSPISLLPDFYYFPAAFPTGIHTEPRIARVLDTEYWQRPPILAWRRKYKRMSASS